MDVRQIRMDIHIYFNRQGNKYIEFSKFQLITEQKCVGRLDRIKQVARST